MGDVGSDPDPGPAGGSSSPVHAWETWLAVCGLKREAAIWGGRAVVGGGRSDLLAERLGAAIASERPAGLISFGVCGALSPDLTVGDVLIGDAVVDPEGGRFACDPQIAARLVAVTGGRIGGIVASDTVAGDPATKLALARRGQAVDMESHFAGRAAAAHGLPLAVLRVTSDDASQSLPLAAVAGMRADGGVALGAILASLACDASQLPALIRLGRSSRTAFRALAEARAAL